MSRIRLELAVTIAICGHVLTASTLADELEATFQNPPAARTPSNRSEIKVTNIWANRLIGDEQQPPDCEWNQGSQGFGGPLKAFPDWFVKGLSRPSSGRFTFTTWNYFTKDSPLVSSGLLGPVTLAITGSIPNNTDAHRAALIKPLLHLSDSGKVVYFTSTVCLSRMSADEASTRISMRSRSTCEVLALMSQ